MFVKAESVVVGASFVHELWDNAVAGGAVVALILGVWISARTLGLLNRPKHWLRSTYLPPRDLVGFFAMPHFLVEYENRGNIAVTFSDFVLALPRLENVIDDDGKFILHPGAELFIDKRPTSRMGNMQHWRKLDYRTNNVRLEPGDSHTDFFDLGAFLPDVKPDSRFKQVSIPADFSPLLTFHDSYGNRYYCDDEGIHRGEYEYPHVAALMGAGEKAPARVGVLTQRRRVRWFGWKEKRTRGLGES